MKAYDYIVVGAGTAGCVLANRLSAAPENRVLLLEAGGKNNHPLMHIPLVAGKMYWVRSINWNYSTAPDPNLNGRSIPWPRGKVLGGCSSINGMMYMRGHRRDYDGWAEAGLAGWSYADVLPYFKRSEGHLERRDAYHGRDGPFIAGRSKAPNPLYEVFLEAGRLAGHAPNDDFNGARQEGLGRFDFNIHKGRRVSSATAFLQPVKGRRNLDVRTRAETRRILFEGPRAVGVEYERGGVVREARAAREVVICGGAVNSPALLLHSGVGEAGALKDLGIDVVADLPGVGRNLQDHPGVYLQYHCLQPVTLYRLFRPDRAILAGLRAKLFGSGPGTSVPLEAGGFLRTRPELEIPDIHCVFVPGLTLETTRAAQGQHGFLACFYVLRPESRGRISLSSAEAGAPPLIEPNYLAAAGDLRTFRDGIRMMREIVRQAPFDPYRGPVISPGDEVQDEAALDAWVRDNVNTIFHPVGTCKMGHDALAVVDDRLRVRGIDALRVIDASVMPRITSGNTNAPTTMIAEKGAEFILRGRN